MNIGNVDPKNMFSEMDNSEDKQPDDDSSSSNQKKTSSTG